MEFIGKMKFFVVGLGSMGKRRVRNLQALGATQIAGFDVREDRIKEAHEKYGIKVFSSYDEAIASFEPDVFVISVSPEKHMDYAFKAYKKGISCFIEASVTEAEKIKELASKTKDPNGPMMFPSCTMRYYPGPQKVRQLVEERKIGKILNINYQTGQYLPDWHPWESIEDYYVSRRETGAAREIVPFELAWINEIWGEPRPLTCVKSKQTDMNADIDDIYHLLLRYPDNVLANITVEVISRPQVTREMRILGSEGEIVFSADDNSVRYCNLKTNGWVKEDLEIGTVEEQYINPEEPYINEIKDFVTAVYKKDPSVFPNTLTKDYNLLQVLYSAEKLAANNE